MFNLLVSAVIDTMRDVLPVALVIVVFQVVVLRERPDHLRRILAGTVFIIIGLILFRFGITESLLPIASLMAAQLVETAFVGNNSGWTGYGWLYVFAAAIGFSATLIEPTLIAVADRARDLSGGALRPWEFRLVVATGVALGMFIGTVRIVMGLPLSYVFTALVGAIALFALVAPRRLLALGFDSGGMATSVVIVPLIAGFSLSVAKSVPGREALTEGFGLVMLVFLMPIITVLAFATIAGKRQQTSDQGG